MWHGWVWHGWVWHGWVDPIIIGPCGARNDPIMVLVEPGTSDHTKVLSRMSGEDFTPVSVHRIQNAFLICKELNKELYKELYKEQGDREALRGGAKM